MGENILTQFALLYVGEPKHDEQDDAKAHQMQWMEWIGSLGAAVVNPGMPMGPPTRVTADGVAPGPLEERLTGLTIVEAESMDAAVDMAKSSPYVDVAAIDVVEIYQMG